MVRKATKTDLNSILEIYAQPDLDDGQRLSIRQAEKLFDQMAAYPDYHLYVYEKEDKVIGTFSMLIMDNLGHLGAKSAIVESVAVAPDQQSSGVSFLIRL